MKKILAVAVASLICSMAAFEALAFEPETVEVAGEKAELSETAAAFAADSIDGFAYEDETYGTLLYYNNFESGSADSPTYRNMDYLADYTVLVQPANAPGSVTLTADPADAANTVLRAQRSSGALFGVPSIWSERFGIRAGATPVARIALERPLPAHGRKTTPVLPIRCRAMKMPS